MHDTGMAEIPSSYKHVLATLVDVHPILLDQRKFFQFMVYIMLTLTLILCRNDRRGFVSKDFPPF